MSQIPTIKVIYVNHRGEVSVRDVNPGEVIHKSSRWHPTDQFIMEAKDVDKGERRGFALKDCNFQTEGYPVNEKTPKDVPILAWCEEPDEDVDITQSLYLAHAEGLSRVGTGWAIIEWGGGWSDSYEDGGGSLPDWWFRVGSEFEEAANPVRWWPMPIKPQS